MPTDGLRKTISPILNLWGDIGSCLHGRGRHLQPLPLLEPISKLPEEDDEAGELNKTDKILGVILPADQDAALPLYPSEETLNEPAPHVTT